MDINQYIDSFSNSKNNKRKYDKSPSVVKKYTFNNKQLHTRLTNIDNTIVYQSHVLKNTYADSQISIQNQNID